MTLKTDGQFLSCTTGSTSRGSYYNVTFLIEGEPFRFNATLDAYNQCRNLEQLDEKVMIVSARLWQGDWILRVIGIEDIN